MSGFKARQYPAQTGAYAVKVKSGAGWTAFDVARFHISVGQEYHEGEKFAATMAWAGNRFRKVIVCVNDTLQRFNYEFEGRAPDAAFRETEAAGREWIERNLAAIRTAGVYDIYRWEEWRGCADFTGALSRIQGQYDAGGRVREAIDAEVVDFWQRRLEREAVAPSRQAEFVRCSTAYLIEECAAFSLMFAAERAVDVYPGSTLLPVWLFKPGGMERGSFTRIDFARRSEAKTPLVPETAPPHVCSVRA